MIDVDDRTNSVALPDRLPGATWLATQIRALDAPRNLFDGSGCSEASYRLNKTAQKSDFIRVRAAPRP